MSRGIRVSKELKVILVLPVNKGLKEHKENKVLKEFKALLV